MEDWGAHAEREERRFRDGSERLPEAPDERQRQLTRMGNAAYGAGLAHLMRGEEAAREWLGRAASTYRESYEHAPPGSWGRPIGAIKAGLLAGDRERAADDARWTLGEGAAEAESPIGIYAAALAYTVLADYEHARVCADEIRTRGDFPHQVADAIAFISAEDVLAYTEAVEAVLRSFEQRDEYLDDVPVADTVIVLQTLAARRGMAAELSSALLPTPPETAGGAPS
ncbi:MAG: hypothetical protein WBB74_04525 [Gaiellaceae bacterium]